MAIINPFPIGPQGPAGADGESGSGGPDWADADSVTVAADWTDAGALGGATTTHKADRALGVRVYTNLLSDGTTSASGNRTQGVVRNFGAGNRIAGMRLRIIRPLNLIGDASTVLQVGPVFVDGTDLSTADWYALSQYYSSSTALTAALLYLIGDGVGFDTYSSFGTILNGTAGAGLGPVDLDCFLVRTGTTLDMYIGPARSAVHKATSFSVSAGAGKIGVQLRHQSNTADNIQVLIMAYKEFDTLPW